MRTLIAEQQRLESLEQKYAWILEGIEDSRARGTLAQLMENQEAFDRGLAEDTTTADLALPQSYAVALIRKVYPALVAQRLASVQPLRGPSGKIFYLDYLKEPFQTFLTAAAASGQAEMDVDDVSGLQAGDTLTIGTETGAESKTILGVAGKHVTLTADLINAHAAGESVERAYTTARVSERGAVARARLSLTSADVVAQKYALAVAWSGEASEDLRAVHSLDAETELINAIAGEIVREIDRSILSDLLAGAAAGTITWSATKGGDFTESEWRHTLYDAIVDANNAVYKQRYRNADFLVAAPDTIGRLEKLVDFQLTDDPQPSLGIQLVGRLRGRWEVYKAPEFAANQILVGIRGDGCVYAPYVPLTLTPAHYDNATDTWVRSLRTRAAWKLTVPGAYAKVQITP